ncbi:hypothetical protein DIURU_001856 [Diutina rugosa]|uniref:Uncharacterized protein n=1 Tax=Diutina rugosa TaxID=5481 RepID=A0A642UT12_DIURU|nr:uncharacterized protein DIURU_001856 [Diutina rugosa]KAA8904780.1 hypothetical protein DIURU_001856 [Diutina rugosa]
MFAAVCSGRPMQVAEQLDSNQWGIKIPSASNVGHISVFMLPNSEFVDANYTALVYFQVKNGEFRLLGGINPNKPSAIYKLKTGDVTNNSGMADDDMMGDDVNIGFQIETTANAEAQLAQLAANKPATTTTTANSMVVAAPVRSTTQASNNDIAELAKRVVGNAYNYLGSFIDAQGKVPMKAFDQWWDKFLTKLQNNPNFLDQPQE